MVKNARNLTAPVEAEAKLDEVTDTIESKIREVEKKAISGVIGKMAKVLEKTYFKGSVSLGCCRAKN